jgi:hypothetical protein
MNKKIWMLTVTLLIMSIMATSMFGTVQACKRGGKSRTVETFYVDPTVDACTLTGTITLDEGDFKLVKDETVKILWGGIKQSDYQGALGSGTYTRETKISIQDNPLFVDGAKGWSINKGTLVINNGPFGSGTLKGTSFGKIQYDTSETPFFEMWSTTSLSGILYKNGNPQFVRVVINGYTASAPLNGVWFLTTEISY